MKLVSFVSDKHSTFRLHRLIRSRGAFFEKSTSSENCMKPREKRIQIKQWFESSAIMKQNTIISLAKFNDIVLGRESHLQKIHFTHSQKHITFVHSDRKNRKLMWIRLSLLNKLSRFQDLPPSQNPVTFTSFWISMNTTNSSFQLKHPFPLDQKCVVYSFFATIAGLNILIRQVEA